jgi:hypothetical protein
MKAGHLLGQGETEHAAVEIERPLQIGDLQMDMADPHPVVDGGKLRQWLFQRNRLVHDGFPLAESWRSGPPITRCMV